MHLNRFNRGNILLDGSNLLFLSGNTPKLDCVLGVLHALTTYGIPEEWAEVNFTEDMTNALLDSDQHRFERCTEKWGFFYRSSRSELVSHFLYLGLKFDKKFIVVSNDSFSESPSWFRWHCVRVTFTYSDAPELAVNSVKELINAFYGFEPLKRTQNERP